MSPEPTLIIPAIYLADDRADYRYLVEQVFRRFLPQYTLSLFSGGDTLIHQLQTQTRHPSLILLDIHMPGLDGRQTLGQLKQKAIWKAIPVVMVTSSTVEGEVQACYEAGANACLTKPIGMESMRQLFEQVCAYWVDTNEQ